MTAPDGIWLARPERPRPGVPVAVKDLLDTAGLVTTYGSILFAEHVPARSAEAVLRLEAAGYAVAGKTNLHEFAYGISSQNPHFGTVPNPRAPGRLAGGSSGGSAAAIAAGDVELALGTRLGWIDPDPRRLVRHRRLQADVRPRPDGRLLPARARATTTSGRWRRRWTGASS